MNNFPTIPKTEFQQRIINFKKKMDQNNIDLTIIFSNLLDPSAVRYFSDFSPINESSAMLIPINGAPILCSGQACHEWSKYKSKVKGELRILPEVGEVSGVEYEIKGQYDFRDLFLEIKNKYKIRKIGVIGDLIFPHSIYKKLIEIFNNIKIVSAENLMYELRMQKSENEIICMKKAGEIISKSFEFAVSNIKPGITELDIQADLESKILKLGAEDHCLAFSPMVSSGHENTQLCMNRNTLRKVREGEIIDLGAGALYEGYNAVICSPFVLGSISEDIKKAIIVAYDALNLVASNLKIGTKSTKLYEIYTDFLNTKGYRQYSPYGSVHSIGMLECETPFFSAKRDIVILESMGVAIDVYFKGLPWGSFRIEDTFIIRNKGPELITTYNKKYLHNLLKGNKK
ncbi:MAG: Xaa-Pro peptidase family protein [Actinobacteria bacterium]|nr:Xaa-Pro peptidase family protein [Actinomycetota bacterium]MCL5771411.1 Xaa-Pro peptidase family protein [Actinomycetota bacterium]